MMYQPKRTNYNILIVSLLCSVAQVAFAHKSFAAEPLLANPLKVHIPNINDDTPQKKYKEIYFGVDEFADNLIIDKVVDSINNHEVSENLVINKKLKALNNHNVNDALITEKKYNKNKRGSSKVALASYKKSKQDESVQFLSATNAPIIEVAIKNLEQDIPPSKDIIAANKASELSPSAGDAEAQPVAQPVISEVPMLSNVDIEKSPAVSDAPKTTVTKEATAVPPVPAVNLPVVSPTQDSPIISVDAPVAAVAPAIIPETPSKPLDLEDLLPETKPLPAVAYVALKPNEAAAKSVKKTGKKKSVKKPKNIEESQETPQETLHKISGELSGDSEGSLSTGSLNLLHKIKVPAEGKDRSAKSFSINRSHDMQDLFKGDDSALIPIAPLGVKVERGAERINVDYELEKAYNSIAAGQSEVAIETYKTILDNSPRNTQALFGLATLYHRARQYDKARSLYSRLLSVDPQHRDGFNNFLVLLADEAPKEALVELEKLESKNPTFSTIPAQMAIIYQKLGNQDKAADKMFRAVALAPENMTYRYNLAIMMDKQKNYDEAAKLYRQLLEASTRGEKISGNVEDIQQRLTFISSNR